MNFHELNKQAAEIVGWTEVKWSELGEYYGVPQPIHAAPMKRLQAFLETAQKHETKSAK
jgi:hypothetical protein